MALQHCAKVPTFLYILRELAFLVLFFKVVLSNHFNFFLWTLLAFKLIFSPCT